MAVDPVSLAITAALTAAQMAMTMSQKFKGPRLDDLNVTLADYGTPIPRFWGKRRLQPQIIWAEKLREKKKTRQTKGGKMTEYKYYGTWAVLICDHEIDAVSRIWMDKHLVYQTDGVGPVSFASMVLEATDHKMSMSKNMRIYLGTEDQLPDPRMEAWCEDRYGPNSCPAYRGSAYIVFENVPLEKFGNRIPQISLEAINNKDDIYPYEAKPDLNLNFIASALSPSGSRLVVVLGGVNTEVQVWDLATRTIMLESTIVGFSLNGYDFGMPDEDHFYATKFLGQMWYCSVQGTAVEVSDTNGGEFPGPAQYKAGKAYALPITNSSTFIHQLSGSSLVPYDIGFNVTCIAEDADPDEEPWFVGPVRSGGNIKIQQGLIGTPTTISTGADGDVAVMDNGEGGLFLYQQGGVVKVIDKLTLSITHSTTSTETGLSAEDLRRAFNYVPPGAPRIWLNYVEHNTLTGAQLRAVDPIDWLIDATPRTIYDAINHAIIGDAVSGGTATWRYLDRISSDGVTLKTVVDDVAEWCGLTGHDSTALTQTVLGYSVTQGTGKDMIQPLFDIHDVDTRPHDFAIQFINRGSASGGTLLTTDFVRDGESRYAVTIQQDSDLPQRLTFNYADATKDQQNNVADSKKPTGSTDSSREETIDLTTYVDTPDGAQPKADRYFRRLWNSRERIVLSLTAQQLALEPVDIRTISLDGLTRTARLDKLTIRGSILDCEWVRDEPVIATLNDASGAVMDGREPEVIPIPGPSKTFLFDMPLIEDGDNALNPHVYIAAGGYGAFPGAAFWRGDDGTYDDLFAAVDSTDEATWGYTTTALASANPNLWDRGNSVNVKIVSGALTTVTEAQINADATLNLAYLGQELLQFSTATLELDGSYTLTGLKRGRRGTEWAVEDHGVGDDFVMAEDFQPVAMALDDVGMEPSFKGQSLGRSIDAGSQIDLAPYTGATLKPYAPARVKWTFDGTDLQGQIIRRTRVGGSWVGGTTIPLSENSEEYEVEIYSGSTLKRTISVTGTSSFTYTAAQMTTDFGAPLTSAPSFIAYQLSDAVGRGFALAA